MFEFFRIQALVFSRSGFLIGDKAITFDARSCSEAGADTRSQLDWAGLPISVLCTWR